MNQFQLPGCLIIEEGACERLNEILADCIPGIEEKKIVIATEESLIPIMKPYLDEMQYGLAAAYFCVGRAGATFLAEITACGLPGILVPYPYAAENHQEYNARALEAQQAAIVILDGDLSSSLLSQNILDLYQNKDKREKMAENARSIGKRDALNQIIQLIEQYS